MHQVSSVCDCALICVCASMCICTGIKVTASLGVDGGVFMWICRCVYNIACVCVSTLEHECVRGRMCQGAHEAFV